MLKFRRVAYAVGLLVTINLVIHQSVLGAPAAKKAEKTVKTDTPTFSLEVPAGWAVTNSPEEWRIDCPDKKDSANMSVRSSVEKGSLSDYVKSYRKEMTTSPNMSEVLSEKAATVAGLPARCVDTKGPCVHMADGFYTCRSRCWLLLNHGRGYQISAAANMDLTKYEPVIGRVLKSFSPHEPAPSP